MKDKNFLALVEKASKGKNQKAFIEICNLKAREVIFLCIREMGNPLDGEDAAQEVFIRMQKNIHQLKAPEAFNVWLNRLVYTTCLNMKRDSMKHKNALQPESFDNSLLEDSQITLPQEYVEDAEKRRVIADLIDDLPDKYKSCILLHYYQHLSYAEIAEVLDVSLDAVNNNMRMARKVLKLELENELGTETKKVKMHSVAPLVALGPVLSLGLQESAASTVTMDMIEKCLSAVGISAAAITAGGAAAIAGTSSAAGGTAGAVAAGVAVKTVAQIAATAAIVLGGGSAAVVAVNQVHPIVPPPAISQTIEAPPQEAQPQQASGTPASVAEEAPMLSGRVYLVSDGPGQSEDARDGLSGIELQILDADNADEVVQSVTTAEGEAQGEFAFSDLPDGNYRLRIMLPDGAKTVDNEATSVSTSLFHQGEGIVSVQGGEVLYLSASEAVDQVDIALEIPTEVQGRIGLYRSGHEIEYDDGLLPGVAMHLLDPQGELVATTPIDTEGYYRFENPMVSQTGPYTLHVEVEEDAEISLEVPDVTIELYPGYKD